MAQRNWPSYVERAVRRFYHPYLNAAIGEGGIDTEIFRERFGRFLRAAEQRGIISSRQSAVLAANYGTSGEPHSQYDIGTCNGITQQRISEIEGRATRRLLFDRRSRKILDGLSSASYEWPVDVLDWDVLDLARGSGLLYRFVSCLDIVTASELIMLTETDLSRPRGYGPGTMRELRQRLAEYRLHLRNELMAS
jgi:hypothetical protein